VAAVIAFVNGSTTPDQQHRINNTGSTTPNHQDRQHNHEHARINS
jgi:hypothetical protein